MDEIKFRSVIIKENSFEILDGTLGEYKYDDILKISVLNEDAKFRGKSSPFDHQVLGGTAFLAIAGEPKIYVGLKIKLKDGGILAVYVSKEKNLHNSEGYLKDRNEAQKIKKLMDKKMVKA